MSVRSDATGRTLTFAWVALFVGLVYYNLPEGQDPGTAVEGSGTTAAQAVQLRLNTLFSNAAFFMLMPYVSMSLYTADRRYYLSEVSARLYNPGSYYIAKVSG